MNRTLIHILIIIFFAISACNEQADKTELDKKPMTVKKVEGLTTLSERWIQDSTVFWTRDKDSTWIELKSTDTLAKTDYTITEKYKLNLKKDLTVKKLIDIDPKTKKKISETDIYTRRLNPDIESRLGITYNYKTENYYADFLDSTATSEKMKANRMKADSMMTYAEKEGLYLCGTAYNEILWEDVPFLPIPREISKDSALLVIDEWTKK